MEKHRLGLVLVLLASTALAGCGGNWWDDDGPSGSVAERPSPQPAISDSGGSDGGATDGEEGGGGTEGESIPGNDGVSGGDPTDSQGGTDPTDGGQTGDSDSDPATGDGSGSDGSGTGPGDPDGDTDENEIPPTDGGSSDPGDGSGGTDDGTGSGPPAVDLTALPSRVVALWNAYVRAEERGDPGEDLDAIWAAFARVAAGAGYTPEELAAQLRELALLPDPDGLSGFAATLSPGGAPTLLADFDPALFEGADLTGADRLGLAQTLWYEKPTPGGRMTVARAAGALGHTEFGLWAVAGAAGGWADSGAFALGLATPAEDLPTTGPLTYTGRTLGTATDAAQNLFVLDGQVELTADFTYATVNGSVYDLNLMALDGAAGSQEWDMVLDLEAQITGSSYAGQTLDADDNVVGVVVGQFTGPNAEETGGVWTAEVDGWAAVGGFGAAQTTGEAP